jgi:hypothetical protein
MPYVHLANGDVVTLTNDELNDAFADQGHTRAYRKDGKEHTVIGIYPDEVEYDRSEDEKAKDAEDAQYQEWKASRNQATDENADNEKENE